MMTTTNTTVFKRMGRILSLVFSDYNEARAFREAFLRLVTYAVLFIIGYRFNLVFDNVPINEFSISAFVATVPEVKEFEKSSVARFCLSVSHTENKGDEKSTKTALLPVSVKESRR